MKKFSDFLQEIALGELNSSNLVELQGGYEIVDSKIPIVIQSLNQALEYLFTQFHLKESQLIIELQDGISRYYLDSDYAHSNQEVTGVPKYILDTKHEPYKDDVLKVEGVYDENGNELAVNDVFSSYGVHTPEYNCIQIDDGVLGITKYLTVIYRACHSKIPLDTPRNSNLKLNIPVSFNTALQTYVASLIYMNLGGQDYIAIGNALYAKFMTQIEELKAQGIGVKPITGVNIKPRIGEWI